MTTTDYLRLDQQVCLSLYSATNALIRAYTPLLRPLDLTYPQYLVMLAMWESDDLSVSEICEKTRLDAGMMTPLLKRLESKGLLIRGRSKEDERVRVISLTNQGRKLKERAQSVPVDIFRLNYLTLEESDQIMELAEKMYHNLMSIDVEARLKQIREEST